MDNFFQSNPGFKLLEFLGGMLEVSLSLRKIVHRPRSKFKCFLFLLSSGTPLLHFPRSFQMHPMNGARNESELTKVPRSFHFSLWGRLIWPSLQRQLVRVFLFWCCFRLTLLAGLHLSRIIRHWKARLEEKGLVDTLQSLWVLVCWDLCKTTLRLNSRLNWLNSIAPRAQPGLSRHVLPAFKELQLPGDLSNYQDALSLSTGCCLTSPPFSPYSISGKCMNRMCSASSQQLNSRLRTCGRLRSRPIKGEWSSSQKCHWGPAFFGLNVSCRGAWCCNHTWPWALEAAIRAMATRVQGSKASIKTYTELKPEDFAAPQTFGFLCDIFFWVFFWYTFPNWFQTFSEHIKIDMCLHFVAG